MLKSHSGSTLRIWRRYASGAIPFKQQVPIIRTAEYLAHRCDRYPELNSIHANELTVLYRVIVLWHEKFGDSLFDKQSLSPRATGIIRILSCVVANILPMKETLRQVRWHCAHQSFRSHRNIVFISQKYRVWLKASTHNRPFGSA